MLQSWAYIQTSSISIDRFWSSSKNHITMMKPKITNPNTIKIQPNTNNILASPLSMLAQIAGFWLFEILLKFRQRMPNKIYNDVEKKNSITLVAKPQYVKFGMVNFIRIILLNLSWFYCRGWSIALALALARSIIFLFVFFRNTDVIDTR